MPAIRSCSSASSALATDTSCRASANCKATTPTREFSAAARAYRFCQRIGGKPESIPVHLHAPFHRAQRGHYLIQRTHSGGKESGTHLCRLPADRSRHICSTGFPAEWSYPPSPAITTTDARLHHARDLNSRDVDRQCSQAVDHIVPCRGGIVASLFRSGRLEPLSRPSRCDIPIAPR